MFCEAMKFFWHIIGNITTYIQQTWYQNDSVERKKSIGVTCVKVTSVFDLQMFAHSYKHSGKY